MIEIQRTPANDERDRRDLLLKKLGEKIDISWAEGKDGMVSVKAGRNAFIVSGTSAMDLKAEPSEDGNRINVIYSGASGATANITSLISGGRMGGAIDVRDNVVEGLLEHVDQIAYTLAKEVNAAHIEGFDRNGRPGVLFFDMPDDIKGAAAKMNVNQTVVTDVGRIAAGAQSGATGDNTVANVISALQYRTEG